LNNVKIYNWLILVKSKRIDFALKYPNEGIILVVNPMNVNIKNAANISACSV